MRTRFTIFGFALAGLALFAFSAKAYDFACGTPAWTTVEQCVARGTGWDSMQCRDHAGMNACGCDCLLRFYTPGSTPSSSPCFANFAKSDSCTKECLKQHCEGTQSSSQAQSLKQAATISAKGSADSAAVGVIHVAEGVTLLDENLERAGVLISLGQESITAADKLKGNENKSSSDAAKIGAESEFTSQSELVANEKILYSADSEKIWAALEAKYGLESKEFTKRLLAARGKADELDGLLKSKSSPGAISKALESIAGLSADEKRKMLKEQGAAEKGVELPTNIYDLAKGKKSDRPSLRSSLKKALEKSDAEDGTEIVGSATSLKPMAQDFRGLEAGSKGEFFPASQPDEVELSIFDVVHRKYRQRKELYD